MLKLNKQSVTSWTRNLIEENTQLKERIGSLLEEKEELKERCTTLTAALEAKGCESHDKTEPLKAEGEESKGSGDAHYQAHRSDECCEEDIDAAEKAGQQRERVEDVKEEISVLCEDDGSISAGELCASEGHAEEQQQAINEKMDEDVEDGSEKHEWKLSSIRRLVEENEDLELSKLKSFAIDNENGKVECIPTSMKRLLEENEELRSKLNLQAMGDESDKLKSKSSFTQSLLEENEDMKRKLRSLAIENDELSKEYAIVAEGIRCKEYKILMLEDLVKELEDYVIEQEDCINRMQCDSIPEGACSREEILTGKTIPRERFVKRSKKRAFKEEQEGKVLVRDDINTEEDPEKIGQCSKEGRSRDKRHFVDLRKDVIEEEDKGREDVSNEHEEDAPLEDDNLSEGTITDENTFTEEDFLAFDAMDQTDTPRKGDNVLDENMCSKKDDSFQEDKNRKEDGSVKEDAIGREDGNGKEDEIAEDAMDDSTVYEDVSAKECGNSREEDGIMKKEDAIIKEDSIDKKEDKVAKDNSTVYEDAKEFSETREEDDHLVTAPAQPLNATIKESEYNNLSCQAANRMIRDDGKSIGEARGGRCESNCVSYREELASVLEKFWISLRESDTSQLFDGTVRFERDPVGAVSGAIFKLREENCDLRRQQSEMKDLVEFLNAEALFTKEELEDTKKFAKEMEEENKMMKNKCAEFEKICHKLVSKYKKISAIYQNLEERFRAIGERFKSLEVKCVQTEEELAKMNDANKLLEDEKARLEMKIAGMVDVRTSVDNWGEIGGDLYLKLKNDHTDVTVVGNKHRKVCKLAKRERRRRKIIESKHAKLLRQRKMSKRILIGRRRIYSALSWKIVYLQMDNARLSSEIIRLVQDRDGFKERYKSEVGLNVFLSKEVDGLQSRIGFFEEVMQRKTDKIKKIMDEKKTAYEVLEIVRDEKREARRIVEELIKEREIIGVKVKAKDREFVMVKKQSEDIEMKLQAYENEVAKITENLNEEIMTKQKLELFVEEERKTRVATEQQLREAVFELNDAKELLESAARRNEENEETIDKLQKEGLQKKKKKPGKLRRWFSRKRKSESN